MKISRNMVLSAVITMILFVGIVHAEGGYKSVMYWGSWGTGPGQFRYPHGVCIDNLGYIYVADGGYEPPLVSNHRVQKFAPDSTYIMEWGGYGSGNGQFIGRLVGVATDSQYIYVADQDNHRIQKFTLDGVFVLKWGSYGSGNNQFISPNGITIDYYGNIYVTESDYSLSRIMKFTSDGVYIAKWSISGSPRGIAYFDGHVYVATHLNHLVRKYDTTGTLVDSWGGHGSGDGQFSYPSGVACDKYGYVYVCDQHNHRIQKFTSDGVFVTKWGSPGPAPGQLQSPNRITVDNEDYVYVSEIDGQRIQKFGFFVSSTIDIDPNTLNLKSQGTWVTCYIELPDGFTVEDIDLSTVAMTAVDDEPLDPPLYREGPTVIGDEDEDGIPDLMVKFDRQELIAILEETVETPADVTLTVSGELIDDTSFEGSDMIRVIHGREDTKVKFAGGPMTQRQTGVPTSFALKKSEPNPFSAQTSIRYALPLDSHVRIEIMDVSGRVVATLLDDVMNAGYHVVNWDGCDNTGKAVSSGVYLIKCEAGEFKETQKLLLIR